MYVVFNVPDDGSGDHEVERYFRKPLKMLRAAIARAQGTDR